MQLSTCCFSNMSYREKGLDVTFVGTKEGYQSFLEGSSLSNVLSYYLMTFPDLYKPYILDGADIFLNGGVTEHLCHFEKQSPGGGGAVIETIVL